MNVRASILALSIALLATPALPRAGASPEGRLVLGPDGPRSVAPVMRSAQGTNATTFVNVPLPVGAEAVDATWYDLQDMGSMGHHIEVGTDGRVHLTWQDDFCELGGGCPPNLAAPQPHPNRGMGYAVRDANGLWTNLGKVTDTRMPTCCIRDMAGGFGSMALTSGGRVAVAQHLNEEGCDLRGYFHLEDAPGSNLFRAYLTPIVSPSLLFPQVAANPNGSFTLLGEIPRGGVYDETTDLRVSYLAAPGTFYSCFNWQMGDWTAFAPLSLFRDNQPAFPSMAASANGRVGVAVGDLGGNVYLIESSNGTFAPGTVTTRNLTNYSDASIVKGDSTSLEYRPYVHCSLAYNDTTPNVVWSEWQARKSGATVSYYDWRSRIQRWSPTTGAQTVYQVPAGVADHFDDVDNGLAGPLPGFNTLSVDWPQVGFSPDGAETYVAFLSFRDTQVDPTADAGLPGVVTGIGFGEISCSVQRGAGAFSAPQNLTNTPSTDERFFSLSTLNPGGKAHLVFLASATNQAGCAIIGDRGVTPGNLERHVAYLAAPLAQSLLDAPTPSALQVSSALRVSPNPVFAHARVRIEAAPAERTRVLEVLDLTGRRIATLALARGERFAEWLGRDDAGRAAPAGVYFARLAGDEPAPAARFVMAR
ncbi:MAG: hypothetical protein ABL977_13015 [Candidatus Eisenbacteria bacterium]